MSTYTLYHNSHCSKSRQALAYLQEYGINVHIISYLENPPNLLALKDIFLKLSLDSPRGMMRVHDKRYQELNLADETLSDDDLFHAMLTHPELLERPILVTNNQAAIGRPLENIMALLPQTNKAI